MNNILNQLPSILLLIFLILLVWRNKRGAVGDKELVRIMKDTFDKRSERLFSGVLAIADDDADPNPVPSPTEDSALLDALVYYFAQSTTARAAINALCHEFRNETIDYDQFTAAIVSAFETRKRRVPPRSTINKIAQLLQGARLIELNNNGFRATKLGYQLSDAIARKT